MNTTQTNRQQIETLMGRYFDGLYHADAGLLGEVLHPLALYGCATGGELVHADVSRYLEDVRRRESPASRREARADAIEEIQQVGAHTAFVRARCRIAERHFTDLLTLVRVDGRWRILAKIFHHDRWTGEETAGCPT